MKDMTIDGEPLLVDMWDEYVEAFEAIPTEKGKQYLRDWNHKIPPKLVRQLIMCGAYFGKKHPEKIILVD